MCEPYSKAMSATEAKGGRYTYHVCQSLLEQGREPCATLRLNAERFERESYAILANPG